MTIYVFNGQDNESMKHARKIGLDKSLAVFGWGYSNKYDLDKGDNPENEYYGKLAFLKKIKQGDIIIYVHYDYTKSTQDSHYGFCTIMNVTGNYSFNNEMLGMCEDYGHIIPIDINSIYSFHRNSDSIHPVISKSLKPRGRYQRIYAEDKLVESISNAKNGIPADYFENEINEGLRAIIKAIQENHPDKTLEKFLKPLLEKIYSEKYKEVSIKVNGSGWKSDHGADLIIKYKENFDDLDLNVGSNKEHTVVVQAKSFKWSINDNNAIEQCKTAINKYNAEYAILITTADISDEFAEKVDSHNSSCIMDRNNVNLGLISVIGGEELAKLYIKYMM